MTNKESFENINTWLEEAKENAPKEVEIVVFGNKADLVEEINVTESDIKEFEERTGINIYKCSAKTGENVEEGFLEMTRKLMAKSETMEE